MSLHHSLVNMEKAVLRVRRIERKYVFRSPKVFAAPFQPCASLFDANGIARSFGARRK